VHRGDLVDLADVDAPPRSPAPLSAAPTWIVESLSLSGSVELRVLVDEAGRVADVKVEKVESDPRGEKYERLLREAADKSARRWTFEPARHDGVVVRVWVPIRIEF
jgi:protein TonB